MLTRIPFHWILALSLTVPAVGALGQKDARKLQQYQQQQMQRMLRQSLGAAGAVAPDPGSRQPMNHALYGQGGDLMNALEAARKKVEARQRATPPISASKLAAALPSAIGDCQQIELNLTEPKPPGNRAGGAQTSRVVATYRNAAGRTVSVSLLDAGPFAGVSPKVAVEDEGETVEVQTAEAVVQVKEFQGQTAKIYYDRFNETGTVFLQANRVIVSINGQSLPLTLLESSVAAIDVGALAKLGAVAK